MSIYKQNLTNNHKNYKIESIKNFKVGVNMNWIICVILYLILAVVMDQAFKIATKTLTKPGTITVLIQGIGIHIRNYLNKSVEK